MPTPTTAQGAKDSFSAVGTGTAVSLDGLASVGFEVSGTFTGLDLRAQISVDGGDTYRDVDSYEVSTEKVLLSVTSTGTYIFRILGGANHARVRVAAISTGTVAITLRAVSHPAFLHSSFDGVPDTALPRHASLVGGSDGTNLRSLRTAADGTVRTDPTGTTTQPVSLPGTVSVNPVAETAGVGIGAAADVEASGNGSGIGLLKRLRTLLSAGLPAALVGGRLDVNIGNTPTVAQGGAGTADWRIDLRRGLTLAFAVIDTATLGDNTIVAADAANKIKVLSYSLIVDGAVAVRWKSGAATNLSGAMSFAANGGIAEGSGNAAGTHWLFETAVNQALVLNLGAAVGVRGRVTYVKEA